MIFVPGGLRFESGPVGSGWPGCAFSYYIREVLSELARGECQWTIAA